MEEGGRRNRMQHGQNLITRVRAPVGRDTGRQRERESETGGGGVGGGVIED